MAQPTYYYVDPAIAANSGTGTIGDPYGDLQFALDSVTRNATDGDQFNIKAGADEIMGAALSFVTYGTPALLAPCIFRGYTSAANDGGIGGITGNAGGFSILNGTAGVGFVDCHCHNTGAAAVLNMGRAGWVIGCEVNNSTSHGITGGANEGLVVIGSHIHAIGGVGVNNAIASRVLFNYFKNDGSKTMTHAIRAIINSVISHNIISVDSTTIGISVDSTLDSSIISNSILSAGGTGKGIEIVRPYLHQLMHNIVEGFSGAGGVGYAITAGSEYGFAAYNAAYNNTTDYSAGFTQAFYTYAIDNETLSGTGFAKSGADTFANRLTYFAPASSGNVLTGGYGQEKGAVKAAAAAAGGMLVHPGMSGRIL